MTERLPLGRILLYSSGSIGLNIMAITSSTWLLYFYAPPPDSGRVQYLPVTLVGLLLTVGSLWDAVIDPIIGHWSDTTRSRLGRRKPFILFAAPVTAVALMLLWTPPGDGNTTITAVYFFVVTMVYFTAYSLVGIPYDGTLPEMAPSTTQRVTLSGWKNVFGIIGVMIGSLVAAPLFESVGPVAMGVVAGIVGWVTIWLTLAGLKETERPVGETISTLDGLRVTFRNKQFLYMFFSTLLVHISYAMVLANLPYFVTLVAGKSESDVSIFLGLVVVTMVLFTPLWGWLGQRYSNRRLLMVTIIGVAVTSAMNYTAGTIPGIPVDLHALITVILVGPVLGGYFVLVYSMMGSVVDYDEMITNRRREAIYYGTFSFAAGLGPSIAALILPFFLEKYGYTAANPLGVRLVFLVIGVITLLGALVFSGYRLGDTPEETRKNLAI
jgi:GPH family glycoside/pentoside/hexuronide:cation symporter